MADNGQADNMQAQESSLERPQGSQQIQALGNSHFDSYQTSLTTRYCSVAMSSLFSQRSRHSTWRKLWLHLAESERALGVDIITEQALNEMRAHLQVTDSDFEIARIEEKRRRHVCTAYYTRTFAVSPADNNTGRYGRETPLCFVLSSS